MTAICEPKISEIHCWTIFVVFVFSLEVRTDGLLCTVNATVALKRRIVPDSDNSLFRAQVRHASVSLLI